MLKKDFLNSVNVYRLAPRNTAKKHEKHLFIHLHGGGYVLNNGIAGIYEAVLIAYKIKIPVLSIDYATPPAHPFPAALEDVISVYTEVLKAHNPASMVIGGSSAGGGLALACVHKMKSLGMPLPAAVFAGTPWADLSRTSDSLFVNDGVDRLLVGYEGLLAGAAALYANGVDLTNPLISPVYGDFTSFPPTYLVSGTRDLLLSDCVRVHRRLRTAGITASLNIFEGMSHGEYLSVPDSPEARQLWLDLDNFLCKYLH